MDEQRLIELETRLAWQEAALRDISDVMAQQQKQMDRLEQLVRLLAERAARSEQGSGRDGAEAEIPPHY